MRRFAPFYFITASILLSCTDHDIKSSGDFIRAEVNGVTTAYREATAVYPDYANVLAKDHISFSFTPSKKSYLSWSVTIQDIDTDAITFPYVIKGINTGNKLPSFYINILDADPRHSAYGKVLAGTSNSYWDATLIITSLQDNVIHGSFYGAGVDSDNQPVVFEHGEFSVTLSH